MRSLSLFALLALLCCTATSVLAQGGEVNSQVDWAPDVYQVGKKYPGYIIKLDGDTVSGYLEALQRTATGGIGSSNQTRAFFYLNESDRKPVEKYKPDEIKGYLIADRLYESINYSGGLFNKPNFNLVIKDGAIRQYEWYSTNDGFMTMQKQSGESWQEFNDRRYATKLIIAKTPEDPIEYSLLGLSFAKKMPPLVSDHKEMAEKISNKEKGYTWLNFFEVIDEYNAWAAENQ
jgi:hypothetical protein